LDQLIYAVNANTDRVEQLQTDSATLKVQGVPALRANLAFQRPRNFRLRAELFQFTGRELDMGSNDELFWFWIRRNDPPVIYYAQHEQFAASPARNLIPVEPDRLIQCLGLVRLQGDAQHEGPIVGQDGRLQVRSRLPSPRGELVRVMQLDATYGWVLQQQLYDPNGQLLVAAEASKYRFYPDEAVSLPHHVEVQLAPGQPAQLAFELDVSSYLVNRLYGESSQLWALPDIEGHPRVDIAQAPYQGPGASVPLTGYGSSPAPYQPVGRDPALAAPAASSAAARPSPVYGPPRAARRGDYRGYESRPLLH
jgi:hypothetical protein